MRFDALLGLPVGMSDKEVGSDEEDEQARQTTEPGRLRSCRELLTPSLEVDGVEGVFFLIHRRNTKCVGWKHKPVGNCTGPFISSGGKRTGHLGKTDRDLFASKYDNEGTWYVPDTLPSEEAQLFCRSRIRVLI